MVQLLILGRGWAGSFVAEECQINGVDCVSTTRDGRDGTLKFDLHSPQPQYTHLPPSSHILVTFPLTSPTEVDGLVNSYRSMHGNLGRWMLLGSTGVFGKTSTGIINRESQIDVGDERGRAEEHFMERYEGVVLSLCGLYGGTRHPSTWVPLIAPTKLHLSRKTSLHIVHGKDIARAVVRIVGTEGVRGRWIVTDLRVYDWWDVAMGHGDEVCRGWVGELMREEGAVTVPRSLQELGRIIDGRAFWEMLQIMPSQSLSPRLSN